MSRRDARHKLAHYIGSAWARAGLKWDRDNDAEVEGIVDSIAEAVKDEVHDEFLRADRDTDRFDAACAAMNGLLANPALCTTVQSMSDGVDGAMKLIGQNAVGYADALLSELAKERS